MNAITFDSCDIFKGSIEECAMKLCQKFDEYSQADKKLYFEKIIQQCSYNQTTNKPVDPNSENKGKKVVRKKTGEELAILEYFYEQDPEWSKSTIAAVSTILGMSIYQVYKWGYDKRNKMVIGRESIKVAPTETFEICAPLIEEPKDIEVIPEHNENLNLNFEVDNILIGSSKYKNKDEN